MKQKALLANDTNLQSLVRWEYRSSPRLVYWLSLIARMEESLILLYVFDSICYLLTLGVPLK